MREIRKAVEAIKAGWEDESMSAIAVDAAITRALSLIDAAEREQSAKVPQPPQDSPAVAGKDGDA